MMNEKIFTILDEIIDVKFKLSNMGGCIKIKETNKAECKYVEIQITNKVFALSLDNNQNVFNCFNKSIKNINKKNDAILFFTKRDHIVVLLIELKSNNKKGYLEQLKAGKNFVDYLLKQIDLFYDIKIDNSKVIYRGILFSTKSPSKGTTKKGKILFSDRNGLMCATLSCNNIHKLQNIKNSIEI